MRAFGKLVVGLGLAGSLLGGSIAIASPAAPAAKAFKMVQSKDHVALVAKFRDKMADYVEGGKGARAGKPADTPEMRIVPLAGSLIKTKLAATEIDEHQIGGPGAEFAFHGPAQTTKFRVLIPVSGHYGLPYKKFAAENEYQVTVEDQAGKQIYSKVIKSVAFGKDQSKIDRNDLITEHDIELPFGEGNKFMVSFWPKDTSKGGYRAGREVIVERAQ